MTFKYYFLPVFWVVLIGAGTSVQAQVQSLNKSNSLYPIEYLMTHPTDNEVRINFRSTDDNRNWWSRRYLIDYGLIVSGTAGYVIGKDLKPRRNSLIGPSFDSGNRFEFVGDQRFSETYLEEGEGESVPEYIIHYSIAGVGALLVGMEAMEWRSGGGSVHQIHDTAVGYAETVAITAAVTALGKPLFARLRPDFAERSQRFHCPNLPSSEYDEFCEGFRDRPLSEDPDEAQDLFDDGRKSFISGHSSHSFNLFGYASLVIGGRYVWGDDVTARSRVYGVAAQSALVGTAIYISGSRITDGRHHVGDVFFGAITGAAIANISYWRRFDRSGALRSSSVEGKVQNAEPRGFRERTQFTLQPFLIRGGEGTGIQATLKF